MPSRKIRPGKSFSTFAEVRPVLERWAIRTSVSVMLFDGTEAEVRAYVEARAYTPDDWTGEWHGDRYCRTDNEGRPCGPFWDILIRRVPR